MIVSCWVRLSSPPDPLVYLVFYCLFLVFIMGLVLNISGSTEAIPLGHHQFVEHSRRSNPFRVPNGFRRPSTKECGGRPGRRARKSLKGFG